MGSLYDGAHKCKGRSPTEVDIHQENQRTPGEVSPYMPWAGRTVGIAGDDRSSGCNVPNGLFNDDVRRSLLTSRNVSAGRLRQTEDVGDRLGLGYCSTEPTTHKQYLA